MAKKMTSDNLLPDDVTAALLASLSTDEPKTPSATRLAKMKKSVLARIARHEAGMEETRKVSADKRGPITTFRAVERAWAPFCPGVEVILLFDDGRASSWLTRLEPGAKLPPHFHPGDEESLVLEGSCFLGDAYLIQGDYMVARAGSRHGDVYSPDGCVLFVRSLNRDQSQAAAARR
jgi:quercetin dioxygenase-like cupin family protein